MKPVFLDFDRTHSGYVTKDQFARVLTTVSLMPPSELLEALYSYYGKETNPNIISY